MSYLFKNVNDWIDFLARLKLGESDLPEITAQMSCTNGNGSSFAYVYNLDNWHDDFGENMPINVRIERRLPRAHPATDQLIEKPSSIIPYGLLVPPFDPPEFLELNMNGRPKTVEAMWTDFGRKARETKYSLKSFSMKLEPQSATYHLLITPGHAVLGEHPFLTNQRITEIARVYTHIDQI